MTRTPSNTISRGRRALLLAAALACALLPAPAQAHTRVESTRPADGDTAHADVRELRLRFSRAVESELTTITLLRGGTQVASGGAKVEGGEGRAFVLALPAVLQAGDYVARWKTVGSDGHVLEGSWRFTVAADSAAPPTPAAAAAQAALVQDPPLPTTDGTDEAFEEEVGEAGRPLAVAVRWAWFAALLGMIGAVAFRYGVLPRLDRDPVLRPIAARAEGAVWFVALGAAALSVAALFGRLWMQVAALGGGEAAWDGARLDVLLRDTGWGLAWVLQAIATLAFVIGLFIARAPHGRAVGWMGAGAGAVLLSAVPALSGHAASVGRLNGVAIFSDTVHVLGAGVWMGTLAALLAVGIPAALTAADGAGAAVASMVRAFSPMALVGASAVALTGLTSLVFQLDTVSDVWSTGYGRALMLKLALLAGVAALGFYNWRRVLPTLGDDASTHRLRRSARAELGLGLVVLLVTAVLVALPTP
ncbi:MAG TPA: CopD family protein [Longimicrobium sp.]|nr:CopD family protein [Longimicrobium sp.]